MFTTLENTTTASTAWHDIDNLQAYGVPGSSQTALLLAGLASAWIGIRRRSGNR